MNPEILPPLLDFLKEVSPRLVIVGSVARGKRWPKDLDLLMDLDSKPARQEIQRAVDKYGLKFESPFIGCWTFRDYGWMVEIISTHYGPSYRAVRRKASKVSISGVEFWVARPEDAPGKEP